MTYRMRRRSARIVGLGLVAVGLVLLGGSGPAGADGSNAHLNGRGWWWEAQQVPNATIPGPPNVGAGQLFVQGSPNPSNDPNKKGSAYAAVRYAVEPNNVAQTLTLKVGANGDQGGGSAVVLACRTGSAWSDVEAGSWSSAPKVDTTACVNGQRSADGKTWAFATGPLQTSEVLDIAIVPGVDPMTKQPSTFSLTFDPPTDGGLTTAVGPPPPPTTAYSAVTTSVPSPPGETPAPTGAATSTGSSRSTYHAPPAAPIATGLPADKVGETATAASKQAASQPALNNAVQSNAPTKDRNKTPGYIVLAFAAAVGLYAWRQDNLMAMNGGSLPGAPEDAGLGRFSRPRNGQPPALT